MKALLQCRTEQSAAGAALPFVLAGMLALAGVGQAAAGSFNLDDLIAAAKVEAPITVYSSTGKIVDMAKAFTAKYGVKATGVKVNASGQLEMVTREGQAKNVKGDVVAISDVPAGVQQLIPQGFVESWLPPDLAGTIPAQYQNPLTVTNDANVWAYNTEVYPNCPIKNIWELTEPKWKGKVALQDPLGKAIYDDWFNQMSMHADAKVADAYRALYGKDLKTDEKSATAAWVKALAANSPLLTNADEAAAQAVGAPGQKEPFVGLISSAKFRDNADEGFKLGLCTGLDPWTGWLSPTLGLVATGSKSPNAARLFIHYMMTAEGIAPQSADGKLSTNTDVGLPASEPSGIGKVLDQLFPYNSSSAAADWDARQDWQDLWTVNYKK